MVRAMTFPYRATLLALSIVACHAAVSTGHAQPATSVLVGPQRLYKMPSEAAKVARAGDTVRIDPGTYVDCAFWSAPNLIIEGAGDGVVIRDKSCGDKGIFVITADNVTVRNLTLAGAAGPSKNNAGIRLEGSGLTVHSVRFLDNENGILANSNAGSQITIDNSLFERNGKCEPECAHGIYVNHIERLRITNSTFRDQRVGHHIKSRAKNTEITACTIDDGPTGTASYLIDIPNGGSVNIVNNVLHKGPLSENRSIAIAVGAEGGSPDNAHFRIAGNRFVSDAPGKTAFVQNFTMIPAKIERNTLTGNVTPLVGPGTVTP
jgi:hypothetical protein